MQASRSRYDFQCVSVRIVDRNQAGRAAIQCGKSALVADGQCQEVGVCHLSVSEEQFSWHGFFTD